MVLTKKSFSKINFFLNVQKKLSNSYHKIETLFLLVPLLYDIVSLKESKEFCLTTSSKFLSTGKDNLCYQAYEKIKNKIRFSHSFHIHIDKKIPISAGLGGGSSNAATTLLLVNEFLNFPLDEMDLHCIAKEIGADVPFFLYRKPSCFAQGIGDKLSFVSYKCKYKILVISPNFPISSQWAYENCSNYSQKTYQLNKLRKIMSGDVKSFMELANNDLSLAIKDKFPIIRLLINDLESYSECLKAEVSGSGPAIFAFFHNSSSMIEIVKNFKKSYEGIDFFLC